MRDFDGKKISGPAPELSERWTEQQAAEFIDVSPATLRGWRRRGTGPKYYRVHRTKIFYRISHVHEYVEENCVVPRPRARA